MKTNIINLLSKLLGDFIDRFKMKSPQAFAIVVAILYGIQLTLSKILQADGFEDVVFEVFGLQINVIATIAQLIVALLAITGTHTPEGGLKVTKADPIPVWAEGSAYTAGQTVKVDGKYYIAKIDHNSVKMNKPPIDIELEGGHWTKK